MTPTFTDYPFTAQRYPAVLPPLQDGRDAQRRPVVVVGGGPVGLTAAIGLAQHGVPVVLIEADDSVCFGSRAICISRRSLEIMQRMGALDGFLDTGLPWTGGRSFYRQDEVLHFHMPQDDNQKLPPMVNLAQYSIEHILLERAQALGALIDIRWQTRVTALHTQPGGVTLNLSSPAGDYQLQADWLVAADGGRSFVRESLGLSLQGTSYEGRYVIVDILMDSPRPTERLAYFDPPCNPGSTVLVHKQPDNVWRIDYQLRDGKDADEAIKPENVLPRVASLLAMMGETAPWQPIWTTVYKANALTLEHYRHGRVLFAGDAAHLVPIFGVRGANSGIDDADNLAWKLAYVIQGKAQGAAAEALLDSYSAERVAATHENLRYGTKSTEFMAPPSFAFELMRKAVLGLALQHPQVRSLINPRQTSAITYDASPLHSPALQAASAAFSAGPVLGAVLPECPVGVNEGGQQRLQHITDVLGGDFTVLLMGELGTPDTEPHWQGLVQHWAARSVALQVVRVEDVTGRLLPLYGAQPGAVYLVRPDGHVLGRWREVDVCAVQAALTQVLG